MKAAITGTVMPVLQIGLEPGDRIVAEPGEFSWMTGNVQLRTTTATAGARSLFGAIGRAMSGGGLFMTEYTTAGGNGVIAFAAKVPGSILSLEIAPGRGYMVHKHGFLCATEGVALTTGFQRSLGAGIFGGDGFLLQRLSGTCTAWVELGGEIVSYDLAPGEVLQVHPGHVGMFEESVNFDVTMMRGFRNAIFGGDGLFIARLTGPGKVWLQSLTMPNLAHALAPYLSGTATNQAVDAGIAGGVAGGVFRGIFGNNG
ncbi:MAG TPA: AIM24 family protein [Acetobacteraceae bacterium]|nr:AIM24 family protein [Acetobacteraceae bacterium]